MTVQTKNIGRKLSPNIMKKEPYYVLDFSAYACLFEVRVNDMPVLSMELEGQTATEYPINTEIFKSGKQELTVKVLPLSGNTVLDKNAGFKGRIIEYEVSNGFKYVSQCCKFLMEVKPDQLLPVLIHADVFTANVPYELESFENSKNLTKVKDLRKKVISAAEQILQIVRNKKYDKFRSIIAKREARNGISMYLTKDELQARTEGFIEKFKNGYVPDSIPKGAVLIYCAHNRAVMLKYPDGDPAIHFYNKEKDSTSFLEVMFHMPKGSDKLEII